MGRITMDPYATTVALDMLDAGSETVALSIPHTPWVPERAKSMARLKDALRLTLPGGPENYREFTEQVPNHIWSVDMWEWLRDTNADWGLQLQDDVRVPPFFWTSLRAMLGALPSDAMVIGLASSHPMAPELHRRGTRWFLSPGNVIGWAYAMRHEALQRFLDDRASYDDGFRMMNEDEQIGEWCRRVQLPVWHPLPTIVDHDTTIPSTYQNDRHTLKRPPVTWTDGTEGAMCDPAWWKPDASLEILPIPPQRACWFCHVNAPSFGSETGCQICGTCVLKCIGRSLGIQING